MRAKIREILEECIENGVVVGYSRAHKYGEHPERHHIQQCIEDAIWLEIRHHIQQCIEDAIWLEIDERFDFERNVCNEVVEGFNHLEKEREWVGLTEYDIQTIAGNTREDDFFAIKKTWKNRFAEAIEDTLKRRNTP